MDFIYYQIYTTWKLHCDNSVKANKYQVCHAIDITLQTCTQSNTKIILVWMIDSMQWIKSKSTPTANAWDLNYWSQDRRMIASWNREYCQRWKKVSIHKWNRRIPRSSDHHMGLSFENKEKCLHEREIRSYRVYTWGLFAEKRLMQRNIIKIQSI